MIPLLNAIVGSAANPLTSRMATQVCARMQGRTYYSRHYSDRELFGPESGWIGSVIGTGLALCHARETGSSIEGARDGFIGGAGGYAIGRLFSPIPSYVGYAVFGGIAGGIAAVTGLVTMAVILEGLEGLECLEGMKKIVVLTKENPSASDLGQNQVDRVPETIEDKALVDSLSSLSLNPSESAVSCPNDSSVGIAVDKPNS